MLDYIEIQWLAGVPYLVYCNNETEWKDVAVKLEFETLHKMEEFQCKQDRERKSFYYEVLASVKDSTNE